MKKNIFGFNIIESKSVPSDTLLMVDESLKKIVGAMMIPKEHFENLHRDGISVVEIKSEKDFRFLSKSDLTIENVEDEK